MAQKVKITCPRCFGLGKVSSPPSRPIICRFCSGKGTIDVYKN